MNPLISVIVPVYNVEKYLDRCVESIVNQTYTNLEIILVDDGSPDNSPQMCDEWAKKDNRIKVIHKENGGVSSARNKGLDVSTGEYIAFVDSDDYLDLDMYELLISNSVKNAAEISTCAISRESPNGLIENWGEENPKLKIKSQEDVLIEISSTLDLMCIHTGNKIFSRKAISDIRFDETLIYCEDILFNYQVALNAKKIACENAPKYHFYYNVNSATKNRKEFAKFDELKVVDKIYELSPSELIVYCDRGDVLKTLNKIKEVVTDGVCSPSEYKELVQRISKKKALVYKSNLFSKITKVKVAFVVSFPKLYRMCIRTYGRIQNKRQVKKYLG